MNLDASHYTGLDGKGMTAFIIRGELLNTVNQNVLGAMDKIVMLSKPKGNSIYNHTM